MMISRVLITWIGVQAAEAGWDCLQRRQIGMQMSVAMPGMQMINRRHHMQHSKLLRVRQRQPFLHPWHADCSFQARQWADEPAMSMTCCLKHCKLLAASLNTCHHRLILALSLSECLLKASVW